MPLDLASLLNDSIASPPALYLKLQKALEDPETTYHAFASIISADTAFASRLLKIVNSPFYGFQEKIHSILHAVDILGREKLTDLAIATLIIEKFKGIPKDLILMDEFWKHSIACGLASQTIAKLKKESDPERYYLSGLFHDVGSLLLFKEAPVKSRMLLSEAIRDNRSLFMVENQYLGFDHAKLGGELLKKWHLPEMYIEATAFHNNPIYAKKYPQIAWAVHFADIIAHEMKLGNSGEPHPPTLAPNTLQTLNLLESDIEGIKEEIQTHFDQMVELFLDS